MNELANWTSIRFNGLQRNKIDEDETNIATRKKEIIQILGILNSEVGSWATKNGVWEMKLDNISNIIYNWRYL